MIIFKNIYLGGLNPLRRNGVPFRKSIVDIGRLFLSTNSISLSSAVANEVVSNDPETFPEKADKIKRTPRIKDSGLLGGSTIMSKMMLKVKSRKTRTKSGLIMLEGKRLIKDACESGIHPLMLFYSRKKDLLELSSVFSSTTKLFKIPYNEMQIWSDLSTSSGLIAICKMPVTIPKNEVSLPVTVICDQIREPGNLGAIFRNAAGAGVRNVILTTGCTDLWDSKVIRGGAGAHFKIPVLSDETWESITDLIPPNSKIFLADVIRNSIDSPTSNFLPLLSYHSMDYTNEEHITLIIGGETEGLSDSAYLFGKNRGFRVNIPLSNEINSLNSAAAVGILLFEIKRQFSFREQM